jgi:hypothetical protein
MPGADGGLTREAGTGGRRSHLEWLGQRRSVVEPAGENPDLVFLYLIDEPVLLIDASRPTTGQFVFQGLGLAHTGIRVTLNLANQSHDSKCLRPVLFDPPSEILEGRWVKF